ncbi:hypothetical protein N7539_001304 [Penicillium diatomitis]|uniref:Uncharacterized protein n=1 Tax=Penicillium diatomitis TaxID=2819901 RepID=A0A9W9XGG3_9EURO|nr:uncharacterized protein N7539_001304 [Penicillium diatomitis]KAJ5492558.1 hypothetical protein N7539_001304 [Penicillium diatomitis]
MEKSEGLSIQKLLLIVITYLLLRYHTRPGTWLHRHVISSTIFILITTPLSQLTDMVLRIMSPCISHGCESVWMRTLIWLRELVGISNTFSDDPIQFLINLVLIFISGLFVLLLPLLFLLIAMTILAFGTWPVLIVFGAAIVTLLMPRHTPTILAAQAEDKVLARPTQSPRSADSELLQTIRTVTRSSVFRETIQITLELDLLPDGVNRIIQYFQEPAGFRAGAKKDLVRMMKCQIIGYVRDYEQIAVVPVAIFLGAKDILIRILEI